MTITVHFLVGEFQRFDESIRKYLFDNWTAANVADVTPKFMSPMGEDTEDTISDTTPKSAQAWMLYINKDFVRVKQTDSLVLPDQSGAPDFSENMTTVVIDCFGRTPRIAWLIAQEVENVLYQAQPSNATRFPKTDAVDSAIARFDRQTIDWVEIPAVEDQGIVYQISGQIDIHWQKSRT